MAEADETLNHAKQWRIVKWGVIGTVASAVGVWVATVAVPEFIHDAHAETHSTDQQTLEKVANIANQNAVYINEQILAQLYLRAGRLRDDVQDDPDDATAREQLARAEAEIRRREAALIAPD